MKTRDPFAVTALYASDATFWGTLATGLASDRYGILGYFKNFLTRENLEIENISGEVQIEGKRRALYSGNYTFKFDQDGQSFTVPGRFSFMYRKDETTGDWQIVHHHSSVMPSVAPSRSPRP